jgi:NTP pyrophosphatase (non-canonical NTP hydrolase)
MLDDYQRAALKTLQDTYNHRDDMHRYAFWLVREVGQLADQTQRVLYTSKHTERTAAYLHLREELADVLWCTAVLAGLAGTSLKQLAEQGKREMEEGE